MMAHKKAARYTNTKAANFQKLQYHFTAITDRMKAGFISVAVWVSIARGVRHERSY